MATLNESSFAEAWRALDGATTKPGWNTLPIATDLGVLLFAGRHHPRNEEAMLIGFRIAGLPKQPSLPQGKGFSVETLDLPFQGIRYYCLAVTRQPAASVELFSAMLADILTILEYTERSEVDQIAAIIDRIFGWQRFMSREDDGVLRAEDELGLLGELQVLRLLLSSGLPMPEVLEWWKGPEDSLHDFVCPHGHIEVKSSVGSGAFSANVSSLDQLDESLVQPLFLAAVQFSLSSSGRRLPQYIDSVRTLFSADPAIVGSFDRKLLAAGYHQIAAARYHRQFSYVLTSLYEVHGAFPRLTKGAMPAGVVEAKYRVEIDTLKLAAIAIDDVLKRVV